VNNAVHSAFLLASNRNNEASVAHGDELILQLAGVFGIAEHRLQFGSQVPPHRLHGSPNACELGTESLVDFTIVDGFAQTAVQFPEIRETGRFSCEKRKGRAVVFPSRA